MDDPYSYQSWVIQRLKDINTTRKVTWIVDMAGNTGKSLFNDLLELDPQYGCISLPLDYHRSFKYQSAKLISNFVKTRGHAPKAILIDAPRDEESKYLHEIYGVLEDLNNGRLYGSFQGNLIKERIRRGIPIFVFTNSPPIVSSLSEDRWDIKALYRTTDDKDVYIQDARVSSNVKRVRHNIVTWQNVTETMGIEYAGVEHSKSDNMLFDMYSNNYLAMLKLKEEKLEFKNDTNYIPGIIKKWGADHSAPTSKAPEYIQRQAQKRKLG